MAPSFFTMEEVSSVKDSVTSRLPDRRLMGEVGGLDGQLVVQNVEQAKVYAVAEDTWEEKMAFAANKNEKKGSCKWILSFGYCGDPSTQSL